MVITDGAFSFDLKRRYFIWKPLIVPSLINGSPVSLSLTLVERRFWLSRLFDVFPIPFFQQSIWLFTQTCITLSFFSILSPLFPLIVTHMFQIIEVFSQWSMFFENRWKFFLISGLEPCSQTCAFTFLPSTLSYDGFIVLDFRVGLHVFGWIKFLVPGKDRRLM